MRFFDIKKPKLSIYHIEKYLMNCDIRACATDWRDVEGNFMDDFNARYQTGVVNGSMDMAIDQGLRSFMLGVYNKMGLGLVWSAILAFVTSQVEPVRNLVFGTPLYMVIAFAPIVILLGAGFMMKNPSKTGANLLYWTIVTIMGAGLGVWGIIAKADTIFLAFAVSAAAFGGLSLFGYTTKKDLSGWGSFLIMALIGLIVASIANIFFKSGMLDLIISMAGVLIFSGLIAFRTQNLKYTYYAIGPNETALSVATSYGALSLYIDFINLFQFILRLFMSRD